MNTPPNPDSPKNNAGQQATKKSLSETTKLVIAAGIYAAGQIIGGWLMGNGNKTTTSANRGTVEYYKNIFLESKFYGPLLFLGFIIILCGSLVDGVAKIFCVSVKLCAFFNLCSLSCQL